MPGSRVLEEVRFKGPPVLLRNALGSILPLSSCVMSIYEKLSCSAITKHRKIHNGSARDWLLSSSENLPDTRRPKEVSSWVSELYMEH